MIRPQLLLACTLLTISACSPAPEAPVQNEIEPPWAAATQARATPKAETPAPAASAASPKKAPGGIERRCGWLENPTPGNWWLTDRDGQWVLGSQGREPVPGMEEMPDLTGDEWVERNGSYGYGCACLDMVTDSEGEVVKLVSAQPKPLRQCRADRRLREPMD
jgi:hypothetical protein